MTENELRNLPNYWQSLNKPSRGLKVTKDLERRRLLLRKLSRLFAEIERNPIAAKRVTTRRWVRLQPVLRAGVENFADFAGKGVQFKRLFEVVVAMFGHATTNGGIVGVTGHE